MEAENLITAKDPNILKKINQIPIGNCQNAFQQKDSRDKRVKTGFKLKFRSRVDEIFWKQNQVIRTLQIEGVGIG